MSGLPVTTIVVGCGQRGTTYSAYALDFPDKLKVVGVADNRQVYVDKLGTTHGVPEDKRFTDWQELCAVPRLSDCAFITLPDRLHKDAAIALANKGYHLLLEKPMGVTYSECSQIATAATDNNVLLSVCHVLRYTPHAQRIHALLKDKVIGDIVNVQLTEPIGFWHFAHSYVRGNWRKTSTSAFSLLTKSCHDLDLLIYWFSAQNMTCTQVSSFGSLQHFTHKNKPPGASSRCTDCSVEATCPYSAKQIYLDQVKMGYTGFPLKVITPEVTIHNIEEAIKTGPYGKCVYDCDNDVVDNQVVNFQYDSGATASFTMVAYTKDVCERKVNIYGTKGELRCDFAQPYLSHYDFSTGVTKQIDCTISSAAASSRVRGHGSADFYSVDAFVSAVKHRDASRIITGVDTTLEAHKLVFLAERARNENRVVKTSEDM